jgi:hypothetical protein
VLDNFLECVTIENIMHDIITGLQDKAPTVKKSICAFLDKSAQVTYIDVLQRISGELLAALIKLSDD